MADTPTVRAVTVFDGRSAVTPRPEVAAVARRDCPQDRLDAVEEAWQNARQALAFGDGPAEHAHWDWRNKRQSVVAGKRRIVLIECGGTIEGAMAIYAEPRPARLADGEVVYVDFVEVAPWSLPMPGRLPKYTGVGTVLIAEAVRLSYAAGLGGRIGLHSLDQAEAFYAKRCKMTRGAIDPAYLNLAYFEFVTSQQGVEWAAQNGGIP